MGEHASAFERSLTWIRDEMTRLAFAEIERLPEVLCGGCGCRTRLHARKRL